MSLFTSNNMRMKQIVIFISILYPLFSYAQKQESFPFSSFNNWQEVLDTAGSSQKNIFIDAYATWCGPCKEMDKAVYPDPAIAQYLADNFISVKVQMDQAENDPPQVKRWYSEAAMLNKKYAVLAYPTYIFLDCRGNLIQINRGFQTVSEFLAILKKASNPKEGYSSKINDFKDGKLLGETLLQLALEAKEYKDDTLAMEIAKTYKHRYYDRQEVKTALNPSILPFLANFYQLFSSNEPLIRLFYTNPELSDSLLKQPGISRNWSDFYIGRDLIEPALAPYKSFKNGMNPDWRSLEKKVLRKYDSKTAKRIILNQQLFFYHRKKDWENIVKYEIEKIELNGLDTAGLGKTMLNNLIFNVIFQHTTNPVYLNKAIGYMEQLLRSEPNRDTWIDTYANLLYKSGQKEKALVQQEKAIAIAKGKTNYPYLEDYINTLGKMKANQPTWDTSVH